MHAASCPSLADARALDECDPLRGWRDSFELPDGVIYLDGNSLGVLPRATAPRVAAAIEREWGCGLIRSWNDHDWIGAPQRVGAKIARLIGAAGDEVIVADSTSVNLFKLVVAAGELHPDRPEIVTESGNFPTDLHVARRAAELLGKRLIAVPPEALVDAIGPASAVVVLSHVHYRTGYRHDMTALSARACANGALLVWDLSHSVGAVPLDLPRAEAQLAVGCGYKYLNGGPGAPAFLYVGRELHERLRSPIAGWMGHRAPFAFGDEYEPAVGAERFLAGTPPIISLLALEAGLDVLREVDMDAVFAKSSALFALFARLVAARCPGFELVTPVTDDQRGSHIAFAHPHAHAIVQALIERGVIGDFRTPDVARFGLTPLYTRFADIWQAVDILADVMATGAWSDPRFAVPRRVT